MAAARRNKAYWLFGAVVLASLGACTRDATNKGQAPSTPPDLSISAAPSTTTTTTTPPPALPQAANVVHATYRPSKHVALDGDAMGYLSSGKRIVRSKGAAGKAGEDRVVDAHDPDLETVMKMPASLAIGGAGRGGFVFLAGIDAFAAEAFDGPLVPIVTRSDRAGRLAATFGFGAVYLMYSGETMRRYAMPSGKEEPLDVPGLKSLVGHPGGFVVATDGTRTLYADAAGHYRPLSAAAKSNLLLWDEGIVASNADGFVHIEKGGVTKPAKYNDPREPFFAMREGAPYFDEESGVAALGTADVSAVPGSSSRIRIVTAGKSSSTVIVEDVLTQQASKHVTLPMREEDCHVLHLGAPLLVMCRPGSVHATGPIVSTVFRIEDASENAIVDKRITMSAEDVLDDTSALDGDTVALLRGSCDEHAHEEKTKPLTSRACVRNAVGGWREITVPLPKTPAISVAVWASHGPRFLGLLGSEPRSCTLLAPDDGTKVDVPCTGSTGVANLRNPASITTDGHLRVIRMIGFGYAAVDYALDGHITQTDLPPHTQFASWGRRALLSQTDGTMLETNDQARTWTKVSPPSGGASVMKLAHGGARGWIAQCSPLGCSFYDGMARVGWDLP